MMFKIPTPETPLADQLHNCTLALKLWQERVRPENVYLERWKCGTQACFGGHLGTWPEFRKLPNAEQEDWGYPHFRSVDRTADFVLFGEVMFYAEQKSEYGTQHQMIITRLERRIEFLSHPQPSTQALVEQAVDILSQPVPPAQNKE